ncbi:VPLPA-CTERM sorting domain-containing protein [Paenirhodobacter sp.]|uniref:VPLPA-CTERM sorting domain-containing protein n=1 Tax=Paenirhodobacter sp. TaxID=1965326 RepID=UPI003B40F109
MGLRFSTAILAALLAGGAAQAATYRLTDLGDLAGGNGSSSARAINAKGQVVGDATTASGVTHAFLWDPALGMIDLGDLPGGTDSSSGQGLNDAGQVVGYSRAETGTRAFVWDAANGMRDLGDLPGGGDYSQALGINAAGTVVGFSFAANAAGTQRTHGFRWTETGGMEDLNGADDDATNYARKINDAGQVAGDIELNGQTVAYRLEADGSRTLIGDLPGGPAYSLAGAINAQGQMAGVGTVAGGAQHAYFWDETLGMVDLGDLPGGLDFSIANGLNNKGTVVGVGYTDFGRHAFVWDAVAGMQDLNGLIDANLGWTLERAIGINDAGQIVGWGTRSDGVSHAYLLTPDVAPVPLPAGGVLLAGALAGFAALRRKR